MKAYKIIKTKTAGPNQNKKVTVAEGFKSAEEAGEWMINNSLEELGPNTGPTENGQALEDYASGEPYEVIFEIGDTRFSDGDWLYDIVPE